MKKSTHRADVVPLIVEKHPNADKLGIVRVQGFTVVINLEDWANVTKAVHVVPDSVASNHPVFDFLGDHKRITVRRFRGIISHGLFIPCPPNYEIGDDASDYYGITRYEQPEESTTFGERGPSPQGYFPVYDLESFHAYYRQFKPGELVNVTEKLNGSSQRFTYRDGVMYVGSRGEWKKESKNLIFYKSYHNTPQVLDFCTEHPEHTLYGECYGAVGGFYYDCQPGNPKFATFDVLHQGRWLDPKEARDLTSKYNVPWVPEIHKEYPFDFEKLLAMAESNSIIPGSNHISEGLVVRPIKERLTRSGDRLVLKIVSNAYFEKKKRLK